MTYRDRLYPWCIIRLLPNFQRITVACFRKRNEAEEHLKVLRRFLPNAAFVVLFDAQLEEIPEASAKRPSPIALNPSRPVKNSHCSRKALP